MKEYLQNLANSQAKHNAFGKIPLIPKEQYVLDNGRIMTSESLTQEQKDIVIRLSNAFEPQAKQCFFNSMFMCMASIWNSELHPRLKYCEGFVECKSPFPVHHAWVTLDGKVVDLTLTTTKYTLEQLTDWQDNGVSLPREDDFSDRILGVIPENWEYFGVEFEAKKVGQQFVDRGASFSLIDDWERRWPLLQKKEQNENINLI